MKERRQRRKLNKSVRVKDQQAAEQAELEVPAQPVEAVEATVEKPVEAAAEAQQDNKAESKQRRNRRSPRHLRASGQRRRRGRDRRPNPFRLRKGGVASPEMAMGKVMPRYIPKPAPKKEERVKEEVVVTAAVPAIQGGFACPEMAMGKVIIRREQPAVVEAPAVETKVQESVEAKVEAPVAEAPVVEVAVAEQAEATVVETTQAEPIVEAPVVEVTESAVETAPAQEPAVEVAEEAVTEVTAETPVETQEPKAEVIKVAAKPRASAPMTKAPDSQELREITVTAAPFKAERYAPKGAGSQVATNRASAVMTKPNFN